MKWRNEASFGNLRTGRELNELDPAKSIWEFFEDLKGTKEGVAKMW